VNWPLVPERLLALWLAVHRNDPSMLNGCVTLETSGARSSPPESSSWWLAAAEWEVEPGRSQSGVGDLIFVRDRSDADDSQRIFVVVEVKYLSSTSGTTARTARTAKGKR
jgi:hypothetical protein